MSSGDTKLVSLPAAISVTQRDSKVYPPRLRAERERAGREG